MNIDTDTVLKIDRSYDRLMWWAEHFPRRPFFKCSADWLDFESVATKSGNLAAGLRECGIGKKDRVALIIPNREEIIISYFAVWQLGAIAVPMNTYLRGEFLRFQLEDSGAKAVIADDAGMRSLAAVSDRLSNLRTILHVDPIADQDRLELKGLSVSAFGDLADREVDFTPLLTAPSDIVSILYTSGTTGMPKGCMISDEYLCARANPWFENGWITEEDKISTPMPLFHGGALACIFAPSLAAGLSAWYDDGFSVRSFFKETTREGITFSFFPGPMGKALLDHEEPLECENENSLERVGLNPMRPEAQVAFEKRFGVKVITRVYGQTECVQVAIGRWSDQLEDRQNSGKPVSGLQVELIGDDGSPVSPGQDGEIVIRSSQGSAMFSGYWKGSTGDVKRFTDNWHHTGDLGRLNSNGELKFVDRKKDCMRRRGENVSAFELEQTLLMFEHIEAVAVHAVPSDLGEDEIKACLVLEEGWELDLPSLFNYCRAALPYFAIPRYVEVMSQLPINATGRVMKTTLREIGIGDAIDLEEMGFFISKSERRG